MSVFLTSAESGLMETVQVGLLALSALLLMVAAAGSKKDGAPFVALFAVVLAVGALREFTPVGTSALSDYVDSHAARYHIAAILLVPTVLIALRDRGRSLAAHVRGTRPLWLPIGLAVVLILIGGLIEEWAETMVPGDLLYRRDEMVEEVLETVAYLLTLATAVRTLLRARPLGWADVTSGVMARTWRCNQSSEK